MPTESAMFVDVSNIAEFVKAWCVLRASANYRPARAQVVDFCFGKSPLFTQASKEESLEATVLACLTRKRSTARYQSVMSQWGTLVRTGLDTNPLLHQV